MSLARATVWTAGTTLTKIVTGLLVIKLLALAYGPAGIGLAGNFRQLLTVLSVLAGAGIFNGVTRYVAEYRQQPERLRALMGTASAMVLIVSTLSALIFLSAAHPISVALFGSADYQKVIRMVAFLQIAIAWANLLLALIKGYRDAAGTALSVIAGSLAGVIGWYLCYRLGGYSGALIGLALMPALMVVPAVVLLIQRDYLPLRYLFPCWQRQMAANLTKFMLMTVITAVTLPVAWIIMRHLLAARQGWEQVGLWQAVSTVSDVYLQFITATFSVWLLPTLSRLNCKTEINSEIWCALRFVLPMVILVSFCVWLSRDLIICLLFSGQFKGMRELFNWQLPGDVLKTGCYVFGYLVIARASLRFYLLAEISQFILLIAFSCWLIPLQGATGAAQAYLLTYTVWFICCCSAFYFWCRRP